MSVNCKKCKTCSLLKAFEEFSPALNNKDRLNANCKQCRAIYEKERRFRKGIKLKVVPRICNEKEKECLFCNKVKSLELFSKNNRGRFKRSAYCKDCLPLYKARLINTDREKYAEKGRKATQKYRDENREFWRSLHRINQFNRRRKIKAVKDGTVTSEFMRSLYEIEICYWCKKKIPKYNRTAEHIQALALGGIHSASNMTMACKKCNFSRLNFPKTNNED